MKIRNDIYSIIHIEAVNRTKLFVIKRNNIIIYFKSVKWLDKNKT